MAITNSKQSWDLGSVVKVGFMTLRVIDRKAVKDGMPDIYLLASLTGGITEPFTRYYEFIPHNGLRRVADGEGVWEYWLK